MRHKFNAAVVGMLVLLTVVIFSAPQAFSQEPKPARATAKPPNPARETHAMTPPAKIPFWPTTGPASRTVPPGLAERLKELAKAPFSQWQELARSVCDVAVNLLSGNVPHILSENKTELLSGNSPKLSAEINPTLLSGNKPEILSGNRTALFSGNRVSILSGIKFEIHIHGSGNNNGNGNGSNNGSGGPGFRAGMSPPNMPGRPGLGGDI